LKKYQEAERKRRSAALAEFLELENELGLDG
jgi:hypothetical protein